MDQQAWPSGPYGRIHVALHALLQPSARVVAPGTDTMIGHMIDYLRARGDAEALRILEAISVTVERLRAQTRSRESGVPSPARAELARLSKDWQAASPIFPVQ
jgi:hypothetical protein